MAKYAQPILFFFCRPCGEYHLKTHPHRAEQLARSEARRIAKAHKQGKKEAERS
ncbi:MAG: hypothetical protein ABSG46_00895 [Candidatus Binataceae bacterium]|jgi:hypothetical protein